MRRLCLIFHRSFKMALNCFKVVCNVLKWSFEKSLNLFHYETDFIRGIEMNCGSGANGDLSIITWRSQQFDYVIVIDESETKP